MAAAVSAPEGDFAFFPSLQWSLHNLTRVDVAQLVEEYTLMI
jgi:hypothetical protein